ncbi:macro domain-containing protein [Aquitalea sp.]|uniref:macro domain-containing protein n=1 Tax=Aquitalea sp. TaxID=1872623 RepID=UPI0025882556|nr:macro domain-containing protein [Aquitalea sp.]
MLKVAFFDRRLLATFYKYATAVSVFLSFVFPFIDIPKDCLPTPSYGLWFKVAAFATAFLLVYIVVWVWSNRLRNISIDIEGSEVNVVVGDIFQQPGLKAIAFNEYFDTLVDDRVISSMSVNGIFVNKVLKTPVADLDNYIESYQFQDDEIIGENLKRRVGKKRQHKIGTICVYEEFLLTAFSKFDDDNKAVLTMPEYLEFLINFWDRVNSIYGQRSVSTTIFGSGITRIKGHKLISDEDLLKIMLWTFRISEMRFKYPAKLTIVIHEKKINNINLFDIQAVKNGV